MNKRMIATISAMSAATRTLNRVYSIALQGEDITPLQHRVLTAIKSRNGMRYNEIAISVNIHLPSLSRVMTGLLKLGYIDHNETNGDQRCKTVTVSPAGAEALKRIAKKHGKGVTATLKRLGIKELSGVLEAVDAFNAKSAKVR